MLSREVIEQRIAQMPIPQSLVALQGCFDQPIYIVGGYLRNYVLYGEQRGTDIDLAGTYTYAQLKQILSSKPEIRLVASNPKIGTSIIIVQNDRYEYTTFRRDSYQDNGCHTPCEVKWVNTPQEDALRRDFTINALYYNIAENKLLDAVNAIDDCIKQQLRAVKNPNIVLNEDGLRLLRLVRQAATHNLAIESATLEAAKKLNYLLKDISKERIREELKLILISDFLGNKNAVAYALSLIKDLELWQYIIPEMQETIDCKQNPAKHAYDVYTHSITACTNGPQHLRLPLLLHDVGKPPSKREMGNMYRHAEYGDKIVRKALGQSGLRFSNAEVSLTARLVALHMYNANLEKPLSEVRLFVSKNVDILDDLILIKRIDNCSRGIDLGESKSADQLQSVFDDLKEKHVPLSISELDVTAKDLMPFIPQHRLGLTLNALVEKCVVDAVKYSKEELLAYAKQLI